MLSKHQLSAPIAIVVILAVAGTAALLLLHAINSVDFTYTAAQAAAGVYDL